MSKTSRIIIVGANGYIGKNLLKSAAQCGEALGTCSAGGDGFLPLRLSEVSLFDYNRILSGDVVLFLAAVSDPDVCFKDYKAVWTVNVTGTSVFIKNVMQRGARVIFFSSDVVYGEREKPFDESAICRPLGEYAKMKREVERRFAAARLFKTIRLSYVFSREDRFTRYLTDCAKRNEQANVFHPFFRSIVHRDDVIEGALKLASHWEDIPESVINFGGPHTLSRVEFANYISDVTQNGLTFKISEPEAHFFNNRPRIIAMDSPVLGRLLGRPPRGLDEAVRREFALSPRV